MSNNEKELGTESGGKGNKRVSQSLKGLPSSKNNKKVIIILTILVVAVICVPLLANVITGSFAGLPPVPNPNFCIGKYSVQLNVYNMSSGYYYPVNGTISSFGYAGYYNGDTLIANQSADGITNYYASNVTYGYVTNVNINDGYIYPNATFTIYANATGELNNVYLRAYGNSSDFTVTMPILNGTVGNFGVHSFTTLNENFTLNMTDGNSNVSIGQNFHVPPIERVNVNCTYTTLWLYMNCFPQSVIVDGVSRNIYINGTGSFIDLYPAFKLANNMLENFTISGWNILPTQFKIIDGQFNGILMTIIT